MSFGKRYQALGRLKRGVRNKTEAAYEAFLMQQKAVGLIQDYWFEGIKLRLADKTFLTIDFGILTADGHIQLHDTKGAPHLITDTAWVKLKQARETYCFDIFVVTPRAKKDYGGWNLQEP